MLRHDLDELERAAKGFAGPSHGVSTCSGFSTVNATNTQKAKPSPAEGTDCDEMQKCGNKLTNENGYCAVWDFRIWTGCRGNSLNSAE